MGAYDIATDRKPHSSTTLTAITIGDDIEHIENLLPQRMQFYNMRCDPSIAPRC